MNSIVDEFEIVAGAVVSRKAVRGFLPKPVDMDVIRKILSVASHAPSGANLQPWQVHVVMGTKRDELSNALVDAFNRKQPEIREYDYYPVVWRSPYLDRRRQTGWGLYEMLGIRKGDRGASAKQHVRNYAFFGAPVVLICTIDNDLGKGSWLDYGMFLQNVMILARSHGLHTCPQAAVANYPQIIKECLGISSDKTIVCGISVGYEDPGVLANRFKPPRIPLEDFVQFHS